MRLTSDLLMLVYMVEEWSYVSMGGGVLYVVLVGIIEKIVYCVDN